MVSQEAKHAETCLQVPSWTVTEVWEMRGTASTDTPDSVLQDGTAVREGHGEQKGRFSAFVWGAERAGESLGCT